MPQISTGQVGSVHIAGTVKRSFNADGAKKSFAVTVYVTSRVGLWYLPVTMAVVALAW